MKRQNYKKKKKCVNTVGPHKHECHNGSHQNCHCKTEREKKKKKNYLDQFLIVSSYLQPKG